MKKKWLKFLAVNRRKRGWWVAWRDCDARFCTSPVSCTVNTSHHASHTSNIYLFMYRTKYQFLILNITNNVLRLSQLEGKSIRAWENSVYGFLTKDWTDIDGLESVTIKPPFFCRMFWQSKKPITKPFHSGILDLFCFYFISFTFCCFGLSWQMYSDCICLSGKYWR